MARKPIDGQLGSITIRKPNSAPDTELYEWRPHPRFEAAFADGFTLPMRLTRNGGLRVFAPDPRARDFNTLAFHGGLGVLACNKRLPRLEHEDVLDHAAQIALFQRVWHTHEFQRREFHRVNDLHVRTLHRASILPEDVGLDPNGKGKRWTLDRLIDEGLAACQDLGIKGPKKAQVIEVGLYEAARRNPVILKRKNTEALVRMALFSYDSGVPEVATRTKNEIRRELAQIMKDKLSSREKFMELIHDKKGQVIHRLAKRRRDSREIVTNAQVRQIILDFGWQATKFGTKCIAAQMNAFEAALDMPLRGESKRLYRTQYTCHPLLGGFPLVLLEPRVRFCRHALLDVLNSFGSRASFGVLHRLLAWYAEMMERRREDDREHQRLRRAGTGGRKAVVQSLDQVERPRGRKRTLLSKASGQSRVELQDFVEHILLKTNKLRREDLVAGWDFAVKDLTNGVLRIQLLGADNRVFAEFELSREELGGFAKELRTD